MVKLYDNENNMLLGEITDRQLDFLMSVLEEESAEDRDYYINRPTLDLFESKGAEPALMTLLRQAMGDRPDMEIRWSRSD